MSMISEQVKELRAIADSISYYTDRKKEKAIREAADTIEALSAKVAVANMERSTAYYNGGWIPCKSRMPDEEKYYLVTILNYDNNPVIEYCLFQNGKWYIVADGSYEENTTWKEEIDKVIAWLPLPEPWKGVERT